MYLIYIKCFHSKNIPHERTLEHICDMYLNQKYEYYSPNPQVVDGWYSLWMYYVPGLTEEAFHNLNELDLLAVKDDEFVTYSKVWKTVGTNVHTGPTITVFPSHDACCDPEHAVIDALRSLREKTLKIVSGEELENIKFHHGTTFITKDPVDATIPSAYTFAPMQKLYPIMTRIMEAS